MRRNSPEAGNTPNLSRAKPALLSQNGYTLLELIVVLVIMSVVMAVLLPRLGTQLSGSSLRSTRLDFSSIAWAARYRAADTGAPHFVVVDRKAGELRLLGRDGATVLLRKQLPQKVAIARMELQGKQKTGRDMRITFYPQGTATSAEVQLATGGERLSLAVNPANGAVHEP